MRLRRRTLLAALGLGTAGGVAGAVGARLALGPGAAGPMAGQWNLLGDLPWEHATTGWLGVANQHRPRLDLSFAARPLSIGGQTFEHGIGTYPVSELSYRLGGSFSRFTVAAGVDDATPAGPNGVRFLVFVDDVLRLETGVVRLGQPPVRIDVPLNGASSMRLAAVDVREDAGLLYADWAEPSLLRPLLGTPISDALWERRVRADLAQRADARTRGERDLTTRSQAYLAALEPRLGPPDDPLTRVAGDPTDDWVALGNRHLIAALGLDGAWRGQVILIDRAARRVVLDRVSPAVGLAGAIAPALRLSADALAGRAEARALDEQPFGRGHAVAARFPLSGGRGEATVELSLFDDASYMLYALGLDGAGPSVRFVLLDGPTVLGTAPQYVTDFSRLRHGIVHDDGIARRESVGPGKPMFWWDDATSRGLLVAALDETRGATELEVRREAGEVAAALRVETGPRRDAATSPRLYVEVTPTVDPRRTHATWKRVSAVLHPPARLPDWLKYQWITWYAFNVDIDEAKIRQQIDYIAENLADLGPWHVLIDAGWYVAEGRPGADWRRVDAEKFPSGLRALVDYAHGRGVRVMGYISVPYLDSRARAGDWLGLGDLIVRHPEWLIQLGGDATRQSYAFDFANPAVRDYWRAVIHDLLVVYDMDAIKIDGLGNAEGALLSAEAVDAFGRVEAVADQAMDIYRFVHAEATRLKPDVYLQAGWLTPTLASPYCHAFWYGDDYPSFSNPYPFPGLREKVDYATISHRLLGQRSNMGNVYDEPNRSTVNRWWLGAGLALGTQVALSFDLTQLSAEALGAYRALLAHYDAFAGETRFGPGLYPDYFATTVDGTTMVGVINRDAARRRIAPSLAELGLDPAVAYAAFDVEADRFFPVRGGFDVEADPEAFRLFVLRRDPGALWTTSAVEVAAAPGRLTLGLGGPALVAGRLDLACPEPGEVRLDGRALACRRSEDQRGRGCWYDATAGTLHVRYSHRTRHVLTVDF